MLPRSCNYNPVRSERLSLGAPDRIMARPTGVGRAISTYRIPIEGRDEWLAAAGLVSA
jgi:hypothetical protein